MATRKKTTSESDGARTDEFAATAPKLARTRKSATSEGNSAPEPKKVKSSAATHKAPARKTVKAATAPEPAIETVAAETASFDIGLHHDEISKEAYYHWQRSGCPQGTEHHHWLAAIEIVRGRHTK